MDAPWLNLFSAKSVACITMQQIVLYCIVAWQHENLLFNFSCPGLYYLDKNCRGHLIESPEKEAWLKNQKAETVTAT